MNSSLEKLSRIKANFEQTSVKAPIYKGTKQAGVMVLFTMYEGCLCILMIRRSVTLPLNSGDWAFPGGSVEPMDASLLDTALRETEEEVGLSRSGIYTWGGLESDCTRSGYTIWPFAGFLDSEHILLPAKDEVADILYLPLSATMDATYRRSITFNRSGALEDSPAYAYNGRVMWGATARIIANASKIASQ